MAEIDLGDEVKDRVSGFKGIVVAVTDYLNQCRKATVQPKCDKDGKFPDAWSLDISSLDLVKKGAGLKKERAEKSKKYGTGGPSTLSNPTYPERTRD
jgi:hypothetical protein